MEKKKLKRILAKGSTTIKGITKSYNCLRHGGQSDIPFHGKGIGCEQEELDQNNSENQKANIKFNFPCLALGEHAV